MTDVQPQAAFLAWPSWLSHGRAWKQTACGLRDSWGPEANPCTLQAVPRKHGAWPAVRRNTRGSDSPRHPQGSAGPIHSAWILGQSVLGRPHAACQLPLPWSWGSVCMAGGVGEGRALRRRQSLPRRGPMAQKRSRPEHRLGRDPCTR